MTWDKSPKRFLGVVKEDNETRLRVAAFILLRGVILDSPVDTGRFRGNWQLGVGKDPGQGEVSSSNAAQGAEQVLAREGSKITPASVKGQVSIFIVNNVPYAGFLEDGSSQQAPAGVLRLNLLRVKKKLDSGAI